MFRIAIRRVCAAVAGCLFLALLAAEAQAGYVGGTITIRIDDEYYALYTQTQGGTFSPYGNATVDPNDPQTFYLPITTDAYGGYAGTFNAEGSGITFTLPNGTTGSLVNWGAVEPSLLPGFIYPYDPDTGSLIWAMFEQLVVDVSRFIPGIIGPSGATDIVPISWQEDAFNAWWASGIPILDFGAGISSSAYGFLDAIGYDAGWSYFQVWATPAATTEVPEPSTTALLLALAGAGALCMALSRHGSTAAGRPAAAGRRARRAG
ncbi:MAG: PEP-CTERM sorting domain-containing protein [Rubrivivax sp.]